MTDNERFPGDEDTGLDPDDPGEVPSTFSTVGRGWSGREDDEDESESED